MNSKLLLCLALVLSGYCHAALVYPKAPDGAREIIAKEIRADPSFLNVSSEDDVAITHPHLWLGSGPKDVISGHLCPQVTSEKCWRYILMHGTNVVGVATVRETDSATGKKLAFGELGKTGGAAQTLRALQIAEHWPQVKAQNYEVRFLTVLGLSFGAIWLHGQSNDIIIPLPPMYGRKMNAYQPYSENQITRLLKPEAERDIAMWKKIDEEHHQNVKAYNRAMMEYEKAHGGNCGAITYYGMGPIQFAGSHRVWLGVLKGKSSKCGILDYKARITFMDETCRVVKHVKILEKITDNKP